MLRVLGAARLSRVTDESTSIERQRDRIAWWSGGQGARVVHIAEDLDVSGSVSPFERTGLGAWLTDERAAEWDCLVAWKLDRISRSAEDTLGILKWCEDRGKRIVCVDDGIDSATQMGRVWIQLAGIFAEVERTFTKERAVASRKKLRTELRWHGEAVAYGYRPVKQAVGEGWRIEIDPETLPVVRRILDATFNGDSIQSIADGLNRDRVLSPRDRFAVIRGREPKGGEWNTQTLFKLLESKAWLGYQVHNGEVQRDDSGMPVQKAEGLINIDEWNRVQPELARRRKPKTSNRTNNTSPLLGVAVCFECESGLHQRTNKVGGKEYRYYYCPEKHGQSIRADDLESMLADEFMEQLGDEEIVRRVYIAAEDHTTELQAAVAAVDELTAAMGTAASQTMRERISVQLATLDRRIAELETMPVREAWYELRPTDETYGQRWAQAEGDPSVRRKLLTDSGIRIAAIMTGRGRAAGQGGMFRAELRVPDDIRERMGNKVS